MICLLRLQVNSINSTSHALFSKLPPGLEMRVCARSCTCYSMCFLRIVWLVNSESYDCFFEMKEYDYQGP